MPSLDTVDNSILFTLMKGIKWESNDNGCWIPIGYLPNHDGYIRIHRDGVSVYLHRASFCIVNKLDYYDKSFQVNHKPECHNTLCFNPNHLYKGDHFDNMKDRSKRSREATHCPNGHEYNETNKWHHKGCRVCLSVSNKNRKSNAQSR